MGPKKPPPKGAVPTAKPSDSNGLYEECSLLLWPTDLTEISKEDWTGGRGDLAAVQGAVDVEHLFVDPSQDPNPWEIPTLSEHKKGWNRPADIFSPFKPVVIKPVLQDPYNGPLLVVDEDEQSTPKKRTRSQVVKEYRTVRKLRSANPNPSAEAVPKRRYHESKRANNTPCYMQVFNSCLAAVESVQHIIPAEFYLWELIFPQQVINGAKLPIYNPYGKYVVRLFVRGGWRRLTIDDRLPVDAFGLSLLTVTEAKEIWPALLTKAILKALGPNKQHVLFKDPMWVLQLLLPGYLPQTLNPSKQTAVVLNLFGSLMQQQQAYEQRVIEDDNQESQDATTPPTDDKPTGSLILVALPREENEESIPEYTAAGLFLKQLYLVKEVRSLENPPTTMVRIVSPYIDWKGECTYQDTDLWSQEFQEEIGFSLSSREESQNSWNDAWVGWDDFVNLLPRMAVFRLTSNARQYSQMKTLSPTATNDDSNEGTGPTRLDFSKWLHVKSAEPTQFLVAYSGSWTEDKKPDSESNTPQQSPDLLDELQQSQKTEICTCTVRSYRWSDLLPLKQILQFEVPVLGCDSFVLSVPANAETGNSYSLSFTNFPKTAICSAMSDKDFILTDALEDHLQNCLSVHSWTETGEIDFHKSNALNIWFKKTLIVKQPGTVVFSLSTTSPGTLTLPQEKVSGDDKKGGKGGKPPPKDAAQTLSLFENENQIEEYKQQHNSKRIDLQVWCRLSLINLDTGSRIHDTLGTIKVCDLKPSKSGYLLVAHAIPRNESYPPAMFVLSCLSDSSIERGPSYVSRDALELSGSYCLNESHNLFNYIATPTPATPQDVINLTMAFTISCEKEVPFLFQVLKNNDAVWIVEGTTSEYRSKPGPAYNCEGGDAANDVGQTTYISTDSPIVVDNITLPASEKGALVKYSFVCTLMGAFVDVLHSVAFKELQLNCQRLKTERGKLLSQERERIIDDYKSNGTIPPPQQNIFNDDSADHSSIPEDWKVSYQLNVVSNSPKLSLDPDTSNKERTEELKASWSRDANGTTKDTKADKKGGKANSTEDDVRPQQAKQARQRYLYHRDPNVFIPRSVTSPEPEGEPTIYFESAEEPELRNIPPSEIVTLTPSSENALRELQSNSEYSKICGVVTSLNNIDDTTDSEEASKLATVTTKCGTVHNNILISSLVLSDKESSDDIIEGSEVLITTLQTISIASKSFKIVPSADPPVEPTSWTDCETQQQKEQTTEEQLLQSRSESKQKRNTFIKDNRQTILMKHVAQRDTYVTSLREAGLMPKEGNTEAGDAKAKGRKK